MPIDAARLIAGAQERRRTIGIIDDPTHFYGLLVGGQNKPASWRTYLNLSAQGQQFFMFADDGTEPFVQDTNPAFYITAGGDIFLKGNLTAYGTVRTPALMVYDVPNDPEFGASLALLSGDVLIRRLWTHDSWSGDVTTIGFTDSLNATNIYEGELFVTGAANIAAVSGDRVGVPASSVAHFGNYTAMIGGGGAPETDTWDSGDSNEPTTTINFTHTEGTDSDSIASGSRMLKNVDMGSGPADVTGIYTLTIQVEHDCGDYVAGLPSPDGAIFQTTIIVEYNTYNGGWDGWVDGETRVYAYLNEAGTGYGTFVIPQYVGDITHTDVQFRIKHSSTMTLGALDVNNGTLSSQVHVFDEEAGSWAAQAYDVTWSYETGSGSPQTRRGLVLGAQTSRPHLSLEPLGELPSAGIEGDIVYVADIEGDPDPDLHTIYVHNGTDWQDLLSAVSAALGDLSDVTLTTPVEGHYVRMATGDTTWVNVAPTQIMTDIGAAFAVDLIPATDSNLDLGATSFVWAQLWVDLIRSDGVIQVQADMAPQTDSAFDLGSTGNVYAQVWADDWRSDNTMEWYVGATNIMQMTASQITINNADVFINGNMLMFNVTSNRLYRGTSPERIVVDFNTTTDTALASVYIQESADASNPTNFPHGTIWCRYN